MCLYTYMYIFYFFFFSFVLCFWLFLNNKHYYDNLLFLLEIWENQEQTLGVVWYSNCILLLVTIILSLRCVVCFLLNVSRVPWFCNETQVCMHTYIHISIENEKLTINKLDNWKGMHALQIINSLFQKWRPNGCFFTQAHQANYV